MFRFAHPLYIYLLALIPLLTLCYFYFRYQRKKKLQSFGNSRILAPLILGASGARRFVKFLFLMLALVLAIFMLARPQYGSHSETVKRSGIEAMIAVDVSNSMLCQDVKPSRLDKSKMLVSKLIDQLEDDKVGLVAFAGSAITLLPMTGDQASAHMFLDQLSPATVVLQGTDLAQAIERASAGFSDNKNVGKALILITDAENHEEGAIEAAKAAKEKGIRIFVLSVGTEQGGVIPLGDGNFKKDKEGNVVTTHLNPEIGKKISRAASGIYINVDQTNTAQHILSKEIDQMQKEDILISSYKDYDEQFPAVAILLFIVLLLELCIIEKKNPLFHRFHLFKQISMWALLMFMLLSSSSNVMAQRTNERDLIRIGNKHYRNGDYKKAETYYRKSIDVKSSMESFYNLGNALVKQGQDSMAYEMYKQAVAQPSTDLKKRAQIYHNMGDLTYASGLQNLKTRDEHAQANFQQAVNDFKSALRLNPDDNETRYNLAMAQYQLKKSKQQGGGGKDNNKDQKNKEQKQNQNQQQKKDQNKDKQQPQSQQKPQPQPQKKNQMDDQTADQLLNSAQQDEKQVQKKLMRQPAKRRQLDKDW